MDSAYGCTSALYSKNNHQSLIVHLEEHLYHHVHKILEHVKTNWAVTYRVPGMNHGLHRNDFSYKKPKGHPYNSVHPTQETKISYD